MRCRVLHESLYRVDNRARDAVRLVACVIWGATCGSHWLPAKTGVWRQRQHGRYVTSESLRRIEGVKDSLILCLNECPSWSGPLHHLVPEISAADVFQGQPSWYASHPVTHHLSRDFRVVGFWRHVGHPQRNQPVSQGVGSLQSPRLWFVHLFGASFCQLSTKPELLFAKVLKHEHHLV